MSTVMNETTSNLQLAEVIRRVQAGDSEAYAEVVRTFQRPLRAWISRDCIAGIDGDDLTQRTFITAYEKIDGFTAGTNAFAWLCTIARNHLRDELKCIRRRRLAHPAALDQLAELEASAALEEDQDLDDRHLVALRACLGGLPAAMATLVEERYTHQVPLAELAERLGTSLTAVKARLHDLRRRLRACVTARLAGTGI